MRLPSRGAKLLKKWYRSVLDAMHKHPRHHDYLQPLEPRVLLSASLDSPATSTIYGHIIYWGVGSENEPSVSLQLIDENDNVVATQISDANDDNEMISGTYGHYYSVAYQFNQVQLGTYRVQYQTTDTLCAPITSGWTWSVDTQNHTLSGISKNFVVSEGFVGNVYELSLHNGAPDAVTQAYQWQYGNALTFDASASSDTGNDTLQYQWCLGNGQWTELSNDPTWTVSWHELFVNHISTGEDHVVLRVVDSYGSSATTNAQIYIVDNPSGGSISGTAWFDTNENAIFDEDDTLTLSGVTVNLILEGQGIVDTTVTDADGIYRFDSLPDGAYRLETDLPQGYTPTEQYVGVDRNVDNDFSASGISDSFVIADGNAFAHVDLGLGNPESQLTAGGPYFVSQDEPTYLFTEVLSDNGSEIQAYQWDVNNDGIVDLTGENPLLTWSQVIALKMGVGLHQLRLVTTDAFGLSTTQYASLMVNTNASNFVDIESPDGQLVQQAQIYSNIWYEEDLGRSVSSVGDVNGDGFEDFIANSRIDGFYSNPDCGNCYLIYGGQDLKQYTLSTSNLSNGSIDAARIYFGLSSYSSYYDMKTDVTGAGDINGDGLDDLLILRSNSNGQTTVYLVYGQQEQWSGKINLTDLGTEILSGVTWTLDIQMSDFVDKISSAGDINGDGFDDLLIGSDLSDAEQSNVGRVYVVYGSKQPDVMNTQLEHLVDGSNYGFVIQGSEANDRLGYRVAAAGDVNGDGYDDFIIDAIAGSPLDTQAGTTYLLYGRADKFSGKIEIDRWLDGTYHGAAFDLYDNPSGSFSSIATAGDVNADGFDDLLLGVSGADIVSENAGAVYLIYGQQDWYSDRYSLGRISDSSLDIALFISSHPDMQIGENVATAGDFDGDGIDDLMFSSTVANTVWLITGQTEKYNGLISLDAISAGFVNGLIFESYTGSYFGYDLAAADLNDDGFSDLLFADFKGYHAADRSDDGKVYILNGGATSRVGDTIWYDKNANAVQDTGESGVPDLTVYLLDAQDNVIATTTTDADGQYLFDELSFGHYHVSVDVPDRYLVTTADDFDLSDINQSSDYYVKERVIVTVNDDQTMTFYLPGGVFHPYAYNSSIWRPDPIIWDASETNGLAVHGDTIDYVRFYDHGGTFRVYSDGTIYAETIYGTIDYESSVTLGQSVSYGDSGGGSVTLSSNTLQIPSDAVIFDNDILNVLTSNVGELQFAELASNSLTVTTDLASLQYGQSDMNHNIGLYNPAPVTQIQPSYQITAGQSLTLDATGTTDYGSDQLTYAWDLDNDGEFDDATGENPVVDWNTLYNLQVTDGVYIIRVQVTDLDGKVAYDASTLTITHNDLLGIVTFDQIAKHHYYSDFLGQTPALNNVGSTPVNAGDV
ncbi:MAG: SdrD B-like domain-containing protein, partial [Phycisphaeraceae bacterium JB051]